MGAFLRGFSPRHCAQTWRQVPVTQREREDARGQASGYHPYCTSAVSIGGSSRGLCQRSLIRQAGRLACTVQQRDPTPHMDRPRAWRVARRGSKIYRGKIRVVKFFLRFEGRATMPCALLRIFSPDLNRLFEREEWWCVRATIARPATPGSRLQPEYGRVRLKFGYDVGKPAERSRPKQGPRKRSASP